VAHFYIGKLRTWRGLLLMTTLQGLLFSSVFVCVCECVHVRFGTAANGDLTVSTSSRLCAREFACMCACVCFCVCVCVCVCVEWGIWLCKLAQGKSFDHVLWANGGEYYWVVHKNKAREDMFCDFL